MVSIVPSALRDVSVRILTASGADPTDAQIVSEVLVWSDRRGRHPQGTVWLDVLSARVARGDTVSPAPMQIESPCPAVLSIDARDGFGHVAGDRAVRALSTLAAEFGVAAATVRNSSHFGPCGYYAARLAEAGFVGLVATNAFPKVAPHGASTAVIGTNPLAFSAPIADTSPIIGDLSTGSVAGSRVREAVVNRWQLEPGMLVDAEGKPTTDPNALGEGGVMLAFGGAKGSALGLLVEILCSGLSGGGLPDQLGSMFDPGPAQTSHFFLAVAGPADLSARLANLRSLVLDAPGLEGAAVRLPGDRGHLLAQADTVELPAGSVSAIRLAAGRCGVEIGSAFT